MMKSFHIILITVMTACTISSCGKESFPQPGGYQKHFSFADGPPLIFTREHLRDDYVTCRAFFYGNISVDQQARQSLFDKSFEESLQETEFSRATDDINAFKGSLHPFYQVMWDPRRKVIRKARIFCYDIREKQPLVHLRTINHAEQSVFDNLDHPMDNVELLDLFSCKVYDYKLICRQFSKVRVLALPYMGCDFENGRTTLPPDVEELIVYNSALGEGFFREISKLSKIKRLVLYGCNVVNHERKRFKSAPISFSQRARDQYLASLAPRLESLEIHNCDAYVGYFFWYGNRWEKITHLAADGPGFNFQPNFVLWDFRRDAKAVSVTDEFPALKRFSLHCGPPLDDKTKNILFKSFDKYFKTCKPGLEVRIISHHPAALGGVESK